ncbi:MAG: peptidoglycan-associated lipoprotein Pal [Elusimicrobia bacterium]|nr:peptidoglycan-associated lipoprotein Pal [Elusimicrobiota bacterium]
MKSQSRSISRLLPLLAAGAVLAAACAPKKMVKQQPIGTSETTASQTGAGGSQTAVLPNPTDVAEARIRGKEFAHVADLKTVNFEFDAYALPADARTTLKANAAYLKDHPDLEVLVEGHCDARGTTEYNLALGQKRAKSVRDYYILLGVPGQKIATISFGKERPLCEESTESCWSRNRRAETKIRAEVSSATTTSGTEQYR